jgi:hypothetical protein
MFAIFILAGRRHLMSESAELLSRAINYAVVQLPGRRFPGVVFQGDSLHALVTQIEELQRLAQPHHDAELILGLAEIHDVLSSALVHYERVCQERGIALPYSTQVRHR